MFKVNDWVKHKDKHLTGKVTAINSNHIFRYEVKWNNDKKGVYSEHVLKRYNYIHKGFRLGIFRFFFFKLHKKWTLRVELSQGWD